MHAMLIAICPDPIRSGDNNTGTVTRKWSYKDFFSIQEQANKYSSRIVQFSNLSKILCLSK